MSVYITARAFYQQAFSQASLHHLPVKFGTRLEFRQVCQQNVAQMFKMYKVP